MKRNGTGSYMNDKMPTQVETLGVLRGEWKRRHMVCMSDPIGSGTLCWGMRNGCYVFFKQDCNKVSLFQS